MPAKLSELHCCQGVCNVKQYAALDEAVAIIMAYEIWRKACSQKGLTVWLVQECMTSSLIDVQVTHATRIVHT